MALLEKAAGQGHAYAMDVLGCVFHRWKEPVRSSAWYSKGAEAGLPMAMFNFGNRLQRGVGMAAPDYPAAADWYRRAAGARTYSSTFRVNLSRSCL